MSDMFSNPTFWTQVVALGGAKYPADYIGGNTGTASSSLLTGAKRVNLLGHFISSVGGGGTFTYMDSAGNAIPGLAFDATALAVVDFSDWGGLEYVGPADANVGVDAAVGSGTFFWRRMNSSQFSPGAQWVLGVAGATRYPTDGIGGATATAASSILVGAYEVEILGVYVSTVGASTVEVMLHNGTSAAAIAGLSFNATALGLQKCPGGARYFRAAGNCNIGLNCTGTAVATLFYRKIK